MRSWSAASAAAVIVNSRLNIPSTYQPKAMFVDSSIGLLMWHQNGYEHFSGHDRLGDSLRYCDILDELLDLGIVKKQLNAARYFILGGRIVIPHICGTTPNRSHT